MGKKIQKRLIQQLSNQGEQSQQSHTKNFSNAKKSIVGHFRLQIRQETAIIGEIKPKFAVLDYFFVLTFQTLQI